MLKGHTGENLDFGKFNVTKDHILARVFRISAQNGKHTRESNESKSNTSKSNSFAAPDFSKDSKTTKTISVGAKLS